MRRSITGRNARSSAHGARRTYDHGGSRRAVSDRRHSRWPERSDPARSGSRRGQDPAGEETGCSLGKNAQRNVEDAARGIRGMRVLHGLTVDEFARLFQYRRHCRAGFLTFGGQSSNPAWVFEICLPRVDTKSSRAPSERRQANSTGRQFDGARHSGGAGPRRHYARRQPRRSGQLWQRPRRRKCKARGHGGRGAINAKPPVPVASGSALLTPLWDSNPARAGNRPALPDGATRFGRWACLRGPGNPHKRDTPKVCRAGAAIRSW